MESAAKIKLNDIFAYYQQDDFYYKYIPKKLVKNIHKKFQIPVGETVLAFVHFRFKFGICFTENGFYWRLLGQRKGSSSWQNLKMINRIEIKDEYLYFDDKKIILADGSLFPSRHIAALLNEIKQNIQDHADFLSFNIKDLERPEEKIEDVLNVCTNFEENSECWMCKILNVKVKKDDSISQNLRESLVKKNNMGKDDRILAYVNTYLGVGTDGIIITETGVFFSERFLKLYYPWNVFKQIQFELNQEKMELTINSSNVLHLMGSLMDCNDLLLFLKQLQRQ